MTTPDNRHFEEPTPIDAAIFGSPPFGFSVLDAMAVQSAAWAAADASERLAQSGERLRGIEIPMPPAVMTAALQKIGETTEGDALRPARGGGRRWRSNVFRRADRSNPTSHP